MINFEFYNLINLFHLKTKLQKKLNDKFNVAFGFYVPYGLGYKYNSDWYGRTHALETKIETFDLALAGSYKITDKLSFGLSAIAERYDARLTSFI